MVGHAPQAPVRSRLRAEEPHNHLPHVPGRVPHAGRSRPLDAILAQLRRNRLPPRAHRAAAHPHHRRSRPDVQRNVLEHAYFAGRLGFSLVEGVATSPCANNRVCLKTCPAHRPRDSSPGERSTMRSARTASGLDLGVPVCCRRGAPGTWPSSMRSGSGSSSHSTCQRSSRRRCRSASSTRR